MSEVDLNSNSNGSLKIVIVRPGSTDLDEQRRIKGTLNIPLSTAGEGEVRETAADLVDVEVDLIFCSPCLAAQQTAQQLSHDGQIKIKVEEGLTNLDYGLWQGKLIEELKSTQPKLYKKWQEHPERVCPPGGETVEEVRVRVARLLKKIRRKHKKGVIVLVVPEPLSTIIRSELDGKQIENLWRVEGKCGDWHAIDLPIDAVTP